jgi:hypothetical protein
MILTLGIALYSRSMSARARVRTEALGRRLAASQICWATRPVTRLKSCCRVAASVRLLDSLSSFISIPSSTP